MEAVSAAETAELAAARAKFAKENEDYTAQGIQHSQAADAVHPAVERVAADAELVCCLLALLAGVALGEFDPGEQADLVCREDAVVDGPLDHADRIRSRSTSTPLPSFLAA